VQTSGCQLFKRKAKIEPISAWHQRLLAYYRVLKGLCKYMTKDWYDYQEKAAALFRSMGLQAATNVTIHGVRTDHDIDVVVKSHHAGFEITWLVECKHWKSPVSKLHVLALREIVADIGADRGILLCEAGFQSGAIEAARLTNVQVTSLENIRSTAGGDISAMRLRELYDRAEACRAQYWDMSKQERIDSGLRADVMMSGYSGAQVLDTCNDLLTCASRAIYPFSLDSLGPVATLRSRVMLGGRQRFQSAEEVIAVVSPMIDDLEERLVKAYALSHPQNGCSG
jgi:restriction system protein